MLIDAHNHLHDERLAPWRDAFLAELPAIGVLSAVVNGTREGDWPAVADLARKVEWVIPSFGLHPWHVGGRSPDWREALSAQVAAHPGCGVGEIGLDRWVEGHDLATQTECFRWQLALAARENLPATIHCLKAWGALWEILSSDPVPARGFLLHAYGGPVEMVQGFVERGAYFSFSPYFLQPRKAAQQEVFQAIPRERLLVETDAPDMSPPQEINPRPMHTDNGAAINHPANLDFAYAGLARLRGWSAEETEQQVAANFSKLISGVE